MTTTGHGVRVLYHIVCAGPPASEAHVLVELAQAEGWDVCVIATPQAVKFIDVPALERLTDHPVRSQYKHPTEPDVLPRADAIVVAPATFNTVNKWVGGMADTLPLSLLCEYVGFRTPIVLAPNVNPWLGQHPAFLRHLTELRGWGVVVLHNPIAPGPTWMLPWDVILAGLRRATHRPAAYPPAELGGDKVL
jgi:phosphopantothenoylcysteine synthetase/decarboxylase